MQDYSEKNYQDFFKEELYDGFVKFLLDKYGAKTVNATLKNDSLITRKGVHFLYRRLFNEFLGKNPLIAREFARNNYRLMSLRNIAGGPLAFPIDASDEDLMIKEKLRIPKVIPISDDIPRATKRMKNSAGPMRGQVLKGDWKEEKYLCPKRLTIHFKQGFAVKNGKTTESFLVESRSEAIDIMLHRFEKKVAYAIIQGEEEFCFVKPRNGKIKRNQKLRGKI